MKKVYLILILLHSVLLLPAQEFSITIDGEKDTWYYGLTNPEDGMIYLPARSYLRDIYSQDFPSDDTDISARVWMAWDDIYLYIYEEVRDDSVKVDNKFAYCNDCMHLQFDPDPSETEPFRILMSYLSALDEEDAQNPEGVVNLSGFQNIDWQYWESTEQDYARKLTDTGYVLECRIPLAYINYPDHNRYLNIGIGEHFGFAFNQIDNDTGDRDHQLQWSAGHTDETWKYSRYHGTVTFLSDHKLKFETVNAITDTVVHDSAKVWYYPDSVSNCDFSVDKTSGIVPFKVNFSDLTKRSVKTRIWDFTNDGSFDSWDQTPAHTYMDADSYSVKLIISDFAFQETIVKKNYITAYFNTVPNFFQIDDIPEDQGGWVQIQFARSAVDTATSGFEDEYYTIEINDGSGWTTVDTIKAFATSIYAKSIPTPMDSTFEASGLYDFRIIAHMDEGSFISQVLSGYSVDNLIPAIPANLQAEPTDALTIRVSWDANDDPDLKNYIVYRSTDGITFSKIAETTETSLIDDDIQLDQPYSYTLAAVDSTGNRSRNSSSVTVTVTAEPVYTNSNIPTHYYLSQNYPNPFNPLTTISYGLPETGHVKITIYNILGHKVKYLVDTQNTAGHHRVQWDGRNGAGETVSSGIYYYQIIAKGFNKINKMILIK